MFSTKFSGRLLTFSQVIMNAALPGQLPYYVPNPCYSSDFGAQRGYFNTHSTHIHFHMYWSLVSYALIFFPYVLVFGLICTYLFSYALVFGLMCIYLFPYVLVIGLICIYLFPYTLDFGLHCVTRYWVSTHKELLTHPPIQVNQKVYIYRIAFVNSEVMST